jgi:hypothetical protein
VSFIKEDHHRDGTRVEPGSATARAIGKYCEYTLPDVLNVKVGAKVMLTRNLDPANGWHNGTLAIVKSVIEKSKCIIIETLDGTKSIPLSIMKQVIKLGDDVYTRQQFPLELGWAITIHKVQGRTIDAHVYVLLDNYIWESGQAYVAISRTKTAAQLHLLEFKPEQIFLNPYYKGLLKWMDENDVIKTDMTIPAGIGNTFPILSRQNYTRKLRVQPDDMEAPRLQRQQSKLPKKK